MDYFPIPIKPICHTNNLILDFEKIIHSPFTVINLAFGFTPRQAPALKVEDKRWYEVRKGDLSMAAELGQSPDREVDIWENANHLRTNIFTLLSYVTGKKINDLALYQLKNLDRLNIFGSIAACVLGGKIYDKPLKVNEQIISLKGRSSLLTLWHFYELFKNASSDMPKNMQMKNLSKIIKNSLHAEIDNQATLDQLKKGDPLLFRRSWQEHDTMWVIRGNKLIICNRGERVHTQDTLAAFNINPDQLTIKVIEKIQNKKSIDITKAYEDINEILTDLEAKPIENVPESLLPKNQKKGKGNCSWASVTAALRILILSQAISDDDWNNPDLFKKISPLLLEEAILTSKLISDVGALLAYDKMIDATKKVPCKIDTQLLNEMKKTQARKTKRLQNTARTLHLPNPSDSIFRKLFSQPL